MHTNPFTKLSSSMADHHQPRNSISKSAESAAAADQPVRSRWTPKPEQILILESIFNSGMVNPPKEETVRIRKLLERFGAVGDANVFYWFQNRRSRSRRRQRQIQASLNSVVSGQHLQVATPPLLPLRSGGIIHFDQNYTTSPASPPKAASNAWNYPNTVNSGMIGTSNTPSICGFGANSDDFFTHQDLQLQYDLNPNFHLNDASNFQNYQPAEMITVFINGVATEILRGAAVDIKAMFGGDFVLFHSSGVAVEMNEYGFLVQGLQHGESYFLVPRCS